MNTNPVGWFEIYVDDMARAQAFYEGTFQTTLDLLPNPALEMLAFPSDMTQYGAGGALCKMEGFPAGNNSTIIYFSCEDCATEAARVETFGGKIFKPKFSVGDYGFIALAIDTEGNMIGLHSMR